MPFPSRLLTHAGLALSVAAWSRKTKIPAATIRSRIDKFGWSVEKALTTAPDRRLSRGGRKSRDVVRPCPEMRTHSDGRAYCRWQDAGRTHWKSFGPAGTREAREAYRRFALEWAAGQRVFDDARELLVGELASAWLAHCAATYRKRDRVTSEVHLNRAAWLPAVELYAEEPARSFTPVQLRAVREAMIEKGWARSTVNAQVGRVVRGFGWAVAGAVVPPAVHEALTRLEPLAAGRRAGLQEGHGVLPAPAGSVAAVLAGPHLHPEAGRRAVLADMVRLQLLTGMRPGELCGLSAGEVDRSRTPWRYEVVAFNKMLHKDARRVVFFGPQARGILEPYLRDAAPESPVFGLPPARKGARPTALTPRSYRDFVHAACDRAGVARFSPNQLRHSRATELMDRFEDDGAAAAVLGNSPEVLRQVYAERAGEGVARRIAEAVG